MSLQLVCPACGKVSRASSQIAGKRVRCSACGEAFQAAAAEPEEAMIEFAPLPQVAPAADEVEDRRIKPAKAPKPPKRKRPDPPPRSPSSSVDWSGILFRMGVFLGLLGLAALILPSFGWAPTLKGKVIEADAGIPLMVIGAVIIGLTRLNQRGRTVAKWVVRVVVGGALLVVLLFLVLIGVALMSGGPKSPSSPGSPPPAPTVAGTPRTPTGRPSVIAPQPGGDLQRESLGRRFGPQRVARITFKAPPHVIMPTLGSRMRTYFGSGADSSWQPRFEADQVILYAAPVDDLSKLLDALNYGDVTERDETKLEATIVPRS